MRARRRRDAMETDSTAKAWCCCVAIVNLLLIVAYHTNAAPTVMRVVQQLSNGQAIDLSVTAAPVALTGDALHRYQMGSAHHAGWDDQHGGLNGHDVHQETGNEAGGNEESGKACDASRPIQFCSDFVKRRPNTPTLRPKLQSFIRELDGGANATVVASHIDAHAPALIPPSMLVDFTLNASTPLKYSYRAALQRTLSVTPAAAAAAAVAADTGDTNSSSTASIRRAPAVGNSGARPLVTGAMLQSIYEELHEMAKDPNAHGHRGAFLGTLQRYTMFYQGKEALVIGSLSMPVVEVAVLTLGRSRSVASIEHHPFAIADKRLTSFGLVEYWASPQLRRRQYDVALCYSVLQHDGLGRYGDALDPYGDLSAMNEVWSQLRPGALFTLSVPIGNDCLVFNAYRVYGRRRLPLLLRGWSVVEAVGVSAEWFQDHSCTQDHIGTIVLKRVVPANATEELLRIPGLYGEFPVHFG